MARREARARREVEEALRAQELEIEQKKQALLEEKLEEIKQKRSGKKIGDDQGAQTALEQVSAQQDQEKAAEPSSVKHTMAEEMVGNGQVGDHVEEQQPQQQQKVKWKTTQMIVQAGAISEVPLEVEPGDEIEYGFKTEGGDIAFCILNEAPDGGVITLLEKERVPSDEESIQGSFIVEGPGRIWLQWDNTYSWLTNKELTYSVSLTDRETKRLQEEEKLKQEAEKEEEDLLKDVEVAEESKKEHAPSVIFVLGGPGSGKGTQCSLLAKEFGFVHLSAGDLLREERQNPESKDGALIEAYIREGKIVPIEITVKLLLNAMKRQESPCFLIDGFPRNQDNLDGWIRETGSSARVLGVLFFDCPEDVMVERLLERGKRSGRSDDNPESIKKRLGTYKVDTMPIIQYYQNEEQLCTIATDRPVEEIFQELKGIVKMLVFNEPLEEKSNSKINGNPEAAEQEQQQEEEEEENVVEQQQEEELKPVSTTSLQEEVVVVEEEEEEENHHENGVMNDHKVESGTTLLAVAQNNKKPLRIILGTMTMSGQTNKDNSIDMFDIFVSAKCVREHLTAGRFEIDTARMYQHGATETLVGEILRERPDLKRNVFVASKANPFPGYGDTLRPESVIAQCNASLKALGVSCLDVLYLHAPDHSTRIESTLEAVQKLYQEGKFRELGISNYSAWETVRIYYICKERGYVLPTIYQGMYNAITRDVERELFPALRALGIRFYAYNPLAGGLLTGKHRSLAHTPNAGRFVDIKYRDRYWKPAYFQALDMIQSACEVSKITMTNAAIRWVMNHSKLSGGFNDGIILGASTVNHLEDNLEAANATEPLPTAIIEAFDNAWDVTRPSCPSYLR